MGNFSRTAGSTCEFWANPVNFTFWQRRPPPSPSSEQRPFRAWPAPVPGPARGPVRQQQQQQPPHRRQCIGDAAAAQSSAHEGYRPSLAAQSPITHHPSPIAHHCPITAQASQGDAGLSLRTSMAVQALVAARGEEKALACAGRPAVAAPLAPPPRAAPSAPGRGRGCH